jgi:hypothetical protein
LLKTTVEVGREERAVEFGIGMMQRKWDTAVMADVTITGRRI